MKINKIISKKIFAHNEVVLFIILIMICILIGIITPVFFSLENFFDILKSSSFVGICSIGFLIVLISGGIDISFTATATITQYAMGLLLVSNNMPAIVVILVPLLLGGLLGAFNAILINTLKAPAIIVTIGTLNLYYGAIQFISDGRWLYSFPEWFQTFPHILLLKFTNSSGNEYGLSIFTGIWIVIAIIGSLLLGRTVWGRKIYAIGGNEDAAIRAGIKISWVKFLCYSLLGAVAGLASIIHAMMTQTIAPNALVNLNFDVLAAVVIGGANIMGGMGSILGTILGVLLVAVLKNGLTIMKIPAYWHQVLIGAILLISVAITTYRAKKNIHKGGVDVE